MSSKKKNKVKKAKKNTTAGKTSILVVKKKKKKAAKSTMLSLDLDTLADDLLNVSQFPGNTVMASPIDIQADVPTIKTVTVVAETATYYTKGDLLSPTGRKRLECGRAAAQAGHAVSKLKDSYVEYNQLKPGFIQENPITNIVLKARDSEELKHIVHLADNKDIHVVEFYDSGEEFYGTKSKVLTAIALGPVTDGSYLSDVTDYLPKWSCECTR